MFPWEYFAKSDLFSYLYFFSLIKFNVFCIHVSGCFKKYGSCYFCTAVYNDMTHIQTNNLVTLAYFLLISNMLYVLSCGFICFSKSRMEWCSTATPGPWYIWDKNTCITSEKTFHISQITWIPKDGKVKHLIKTNQNWL